MIVAPFFCFGFILSDHQIGQYGGKRKSPVGDWTLLYLLKPPEAKKPKKTFVETSPAKKMARKIEHLYMMTPKPFTNSIAGMIMMHLGELPAVLPLGYLHSLSFSSWLFVGVHNGKLFHQN